MTARERQASEGTSAPLTAQSAAREAARCAGRNGAEPGLSGALVWEDWFEHAAPAQRQEMLALAVRQGLIYSSQVPPPINGKSKSVFDSLPHPCVRLLGGKTENLAPVAAEAVAVLDQELDLAQREAVARALATPDVFLLEGLPGTGRSRVLAEILHQSALRGERALFLAKEPAALDVVLARLADGQPVFPIRYLDPEETADALAAPLARLTPALRPRVFKERMLQNAAAATLDAECRVRRRQAEETCWRELHAISAQLDAAQRRLCEAERKLAVATDEVRNEVSVRRPLAEAIEILQLARDERLAALHIDQGKKTKENATLTAQVADVNEALKRLRPLAQAKKEGRWWTPAWWRATLGGQVQAKLAVLEARCQAANSALQDNTTAQAEITQECNRVLQAFEAERDRLISTEIERRCNQRRREIAAGQEEVGKLVDAWRQQACELEVADHRPMDTTAEALAAARERWEKHRQADLQAHDFAGRLEAFAKKVADGMAARVVEWATVFAGTMDALAGDCSFAEIAAGPFDVLILEDADQFTEADLIKAGRGAKRWVLAAEGPLPAPLTGSACSNGKILAPALAGWFAKLWHRLHPGPGQTAYLWSAQDGRLYCTLRPLSARDHAHLETERVADFPDIELDILVVPKTAPAVARVVFPATMTLAEAKRFIYRELEEAAIQTAGRSAWLASAEDGLRLYLSPLAQSGGDCLELEPGLREWLTPGTAQTCRLDFREADGWTPARVGQWLDTHMDWRDRGRTMALRVPYRMPSGLACAMNSILFERGYLCSARAEGVQVGLEFVAVPPLRADARQDQKRRTGGSGGPGVLSRDGTGLELDLASPHGADRMPAELRAELPRRGVANYLEAQALIRRLEELMKEGAEGPVAVIALQEGQAALLRQLASRSEHLPHYAALYKIGTPVDFEQREWPTVLVSLTRSHGRRVMPYGERAGDLVRSFTRAQKRLIVFGDVGQLIKRGQCQGPLDRQGEHAAAAEARIASALAGWVTDASRKVL